MPFGKGRGYVNQGGELMRCQDEKREYRTALEAIWKLHDTSGWTDRGNPFPPCDCGVCEILRDVFRRWPKGAA